MRHRCKYEYTNEYNARHLWSVVGRHGAIHLHISDMGKERSEKYCTEQFSGGIEIHYRQPPSYMRNDAPSQDRCWLLQGPCWHDGSSLQVSESWIPRWRASPHDHERMFTMLKSEYDDIFKFVFMFEKP